MAKETMDRRASDNDYLHKDFHGALSAGIEYLHDHYGADAVRDYLRQFTITYYAPLIRKLKQEGLSALREHFEKMYEIEGCDTEITCTDDELVISVETCPAVRHMQANGYPVARLFHETTKTVNEALCEGTPFAAVLVEHDEKTGRCVQRFYRRRS